MVRLGLAVIALSLAAVAAGAAEDAPVSKPPTPMQLVQQRAAREKLERQARIAARKQARQPQPRVFYPGEGFPAQPVRDRIDYEFPRRAAQSLGRPWQAR
jgi:hypothetical protein